MGGGEYLIQGSDESAINSEFTTSHVLVEGFDGTFVEGPEGNYILLRTWQEVL